MTRFCVLAAVLVLSLMACSGGTESTDGGLESGMDASGFDGHSHRGAIDRATLDRFSSAGSGSAKTKFILTEFPDDARRTIWFMEGGFYTLHDEWYWYHLLNGVALPGLDVAPVQGQRFATIQEIVGWARTRTTLPLDLTWVEGSRLYSPHFYELALGTPRTLGLGSIVHFEARSQRPELWLFELEYSDRITHPDLVRYFQDLESALPKEIGPKILWVVRSPGQQARADQMKTSKLAYWDRVVTYQDVVIPGEVEVYSPGLTAGRPRIIHSGEPLTGTSSDELLFLEEVPDWLPVCAGLVTAVPQTPLAHIALLARNRGIPSAYLGGVLERPDIDQLERAHAPAIVQAVPPDQLRIQAMTWSQYNTWKQLRQATPIAVPSIDLASAPLVVDLASLPASEVEGKRPLIGGKGTGMANLLRALPDPRASLSGPHAPISITVKAYAEHLLPLRPQIQAVLQDAAFSANEKARFLVLEGIEDYDARYPDQASRSYRAELVAARQAGDPLAELVAKGGVRRALRDLPLAPATLASITAELQSRFGGYAPAQALRLRSSSNVEDAQGFNGAGLYDSNSGFLMPSAQSDPDDRKKSMEWALKKTWASYWSSEAFEERRSANVPHLQGAMAVLVHAEFDDALEAANGVLTVTLRRDGGSPRLSMEVNSQPGAESVTNPSTPGALPEVVLVERAANADPPVIRRIRPSTLTVNGAPVLTDAELLQLFEGTAAVAEAWLDAQNSAADAARADRVVVLDFEHRLVKAGWPAMATGEAYPARLVLKQVRSLDPAIALGAAALRLPAPRDVLARARRVERRSCAGPSVQLTETAVYTDPNRLPDLGFSQQPFTASLVVVLSAAIPELELPQGHRVDLDHTGLASVTRPDAQGFSLLAALSESAASIAGFSVVEAHGSGAWRLTHGADTASGIGLQCTTSVLYSAPEDYLLSLLKDE
ncbi:MAG: hypothetical protein HY901_32480 [Deltaproteobacteria bacterium]|nr:hypothetical protein [Deltaproteobacteria bacterium]